MPETVRSRTLELSLSIVALLVVCAAAFMADWYRQLPWFGVTGLVVTIAFATAAYLLGGVNGSGAVAGCAIALALYWFSGPAAFITLMIVFVLTSISTRSGYGRKRRLGKAENRRGRSGGQVLANLAVAAVCVMIRGLLLNRTAPLPAAKLLLAIAMVAALAEAAADTVSSECGIAWSDRVWLITNGTRVSPGTDGGISLPGTIAGAVAGVVIVCVCASLRIIPWSAILLVTGAAVAGMLFDSLLGATLERRRVIGNNVVNLSGTVFAALTALLAANL